MSHLKERAEKICLNCNAQLSGIYCHICGQENIEPKESVWHLVTHYFNDITHFDGKFFSTSWYLLFRPGFLPAAYSRGRRASYLNPIRMYVFTSAFFFLIFFSFIQPKDALVVKSDNSVKTVLTELEKDRSKLLNKYKNEKDSAKILELKNLIKLTAADIDSLTRDSTSITRLNTYGDNFKVSELIDDKYENRRAYDSIQKTLPPGKQDGYIERTFTHKMYDLAEKYKDDGKSIISVFSDKFVHYFPQLLFISLPFFALLLKLLYTRRKEFYYVNHIIFTLHFYIFCFITLLVIFSFTKLNSMLHWSFLSTLAGITWITIFFYLYKAMRNFYGQGRGKTFVKFLLLNFLFLFVLIFLFIILFFYSLFQL